MAQGNVRGKVGGGDKINGIIEQYLAQGDINAGGFVKFVNDSETIVTDTQLSTVGWTGKSICAIELKDEVVFIAHLYTGVSHYALYGTICEVNSNGITINSSTQINGNVPQINSISAVKVNDNKVFIAYANSSKHLDGVICDINNNIITVTTDMELTSGYNSNPSISAILLDSNKVFIAHNFEDNKYLHGLICTLSSNTITIGTDTELYNDNSNTAYIAAVKINENKVFIVFSTSGLRAMLCEINQTTITVKSKKKLQNVIASLISVKELINGKIFICYCNSDNNKYYLFGLICTINADEDTITDGINTLLSKLGNVDGSTSILKFSPSKIYICYSGITSYYLMEMICTIKDNIITVEKDNQLNGENYSGYSISTVKINNNAFIAHSIGTEYYLNAMLQEIKLGVKLLESSTDKIFGVAKLNAVEGQMAKIYVPNLGVG